MIVQRIDELEVMPFAEFAFYVLIFQGQVVGHTGFQPGVARFAKHLHVQPEFLFKQAFNLPGRHFGFYVQIAAVRLFFEKRGGAKEARWVYR